MFDKKIYGLLKKQLDEAGIIDVNELKADVDELYSLLSGKVYFRGETTTPLIDGSTTNPIVINGVSTVAEAGNLVIYNSTQFIFDGTRWIQLSTVSALGLLAYQDSAIANYTPRGTVSQPTFTGNSMSMSTNYTPAGTVSKPTFTGAQGNVTVTGTPTFTGTQATIRPTVTAAGTVSKPNVDVTKSTTTVNSITHVGSLPVLATQVQDETLTITFGQGSLPTKGNDTTVMTNATAALASAPTFTGTQVQGSATYTPTGTIGAVTSTGTFTPSGEVSTPAFTGTQATVSVSGTPSGTVSQPTFTGTEATIVSE